MSNRHMTMVVMLNSGADIPGSWLMIQDITRKMALASEVLARGDLNFSEFVSQNG
jgi:hypothetical protein